MDLFFFFLQYQEDSIWLFTNEKFDGSVPFTVQAKYEGFSEGSDFIANCITGRFYRSSG